MQKRQKCGLFGCNGFMMNIMDEGRKRALCVLVEQWLEFQRKV